MDQQKTLPAAPVSTWNIGLSERIKDRLIMAGIALGGVLTLVWGMLLVLLAWEIFSFVL